MLTRNSSVLLSASLLISVVATGLKAEELFLRDAETAKAVQLVAGEGVDLGVAGVSAPLEGVDGWLVWRKEGDFIGADGLRHVLYKQYLRGSGPLFGREIPTAKGTLGVHFDRKGNPFLVYGYQERTTKVANRLFYNTSNAAAYAAVTATTGAVDFRLADLSDVARASWEKSPVLVLALNQEGTSLVLAWQVPLPYTGYRAEIDAETGKLRSLVQVLASSSCNPDTSNGVAAYAIPQRSDLFAGRTVYCTDAPSRPYPFFYEAHWPREVGTSPAVEGYEGRQTLYCDGVGRRYGLVALGRNVIGIPIYEDNPSVAPNGSKAGDALYYTRLTFSTLKKLGRIGYRGPSDPTQSLPAQLVVNQTYVICGAFYVLTDQDFPGSGPVDGVIFGACTPSEGYEESACLDIVGHEWGHGVVKYSPANWGYDKYGFGGQLHEGFADVIGHFVEWDNPLAPANPSVPIPPDWELGRHCKSSVKRNVDGLGRDGVAQLFAGGYHRFHDQTNTEAHFRGNQLPVAFRLLSVGGSNPICGMPGWPQYDCSISVSSQGINYARQLFLDILTYATPSTTWERLPDLAFVAATAGWPSGNWCTVASVKAGQDAFKAIGYAGTICP